MKLTDTQIEFNRRISTHDVGFQPVAESPLYETSIAGLLEGTPDEGIFDGSCTILSPEPLTELPAGMRITGIGMQARISGLIVWLDGRIGSVTIQVGRDDATVIFDRNCQISRADIRLFRQAYVRFGISTSVNSALLVVDNGCFTTDEDCMFSSDVTIQVGDQHSLWSLDSDRGVTELNRDSVSLKLEPHVWIGRGATLLASNNVIGKGSVVGAGAVLASGVASETAVVGNPAKVVRENVTWSRNIDIFTDREDKLLNLHDAPNFKKRET